jgi:hypothetical protein
VLSENFPIIWSIHFLVISSPCRRLLCLHSLRMIKPPSPGRLYQMLTLGETEFFGVEFRFCSIRRKIYFSAVYIGRKLMMRFVLWIPVIVNIVRFRSTGITGIFNGLTIIDFSASIGASLTKFDAFNGLVAFWYAVFHVTKPKNEQIRRKSDQFSKIAQALTCLRKSTSETLETTAVMQTNCIIRNDSTIKMFYLPRFCLRHVKIDERDRLFGTDDTAPMVIATML